MLTTEENVVAKVMESIDLDSAMQWSELRLLPFNPTKYKTLYLDRGNTRKSCHVGSTELQEVNEQLDLGIIMAGELSFRKHVSV